MAAPSVRPLASGSDTTRDITSSGSRRFKFQQLLGHPHQISADGFGRTYRPLEERLKALDDQLPRLQAELDFLRIQNLSRDEIVAEAQDLYGRWTDLLPGEKRQIIENVVERITIGKGSVSIDLAYIPSPSSMAAKRQRGHTGSSPRRALPWRGRSRKVIGPVSDKERLCHRNSHFIRAIDKGGYVRGTAT